MRDEEAEKLGYETQPYVLIVGGGQGAIGLGARLRQLGVPAIIAEKNERAGDSWRKRYKSLCLHDPVWYDHLPYIDFPKNWPVFSPKDKIGDWLEMYAKVMELNYWTKTTVKSAKYDPKKKEWAVVVDRDGKEVTLKPKQLVFATGMSSKPNLPRFKGMETFKGEQHHSSAHPGPDGYKGKKVVVIGSNNSAHDICAALYEAGVDVTMVQRSSTHIVRSSNVDGDRLGRSLFGARGARRHDDSQGRPHLRLLAVRHSRLAAEAGLRQDPGGRRRFLQRSREGGLQARLWRGRIRPVHEISAPGLGLLHRRRRLAADHRRQGQARNGASGGDHARTASSSRAARKFQPT